MRVQDLLLVILCLGAVRCQTCMGGDVTGLPLLAGAQVLGHGFNAKTGQNGTGLFGLDQVFRWSFQNGCSWTSPSSNKTYSVPDQLSFSDVAHSVTNLAAVLSANYSSMLDEYASWFYFYGGVPAGAFSLAFAYAHELFVERGQLSLSTMLAGWSEFYVEYYMLNAPPAYMLLQNLSNGFLLSKQGLPSTINSTSDSQEYAEFVAAYGTHYVCNAVFGGHVHQATFLSNSIVVKHSVQTVATQFEMMFAYTLFDISGGFVSNRNQIALETWFMENAQVHTFFTGGNPTLMSNATLGEWLASVPDGAVPLETTLCPLSELFADEPTKAATLDAFIAQYMSST